MSDITLTLVPWAPGTSVGAYPRRSEQLRPDGPPTGITPTDTEIVASDASLSYNLSDGEYWAAAPLNGSGTWQYVAFVAETPFDDEGHALAASQSPNGNWHEVMVDDIGRLSTVDLGPSQPPHGPPPYATLGDLDAVEISVAGKADKSVLKLHAKDTLVPFADVKGDGTTDDTAALAARFNYLGAGGTVVLTRGQSYVVGDLAFTHEGQVLEGDAAGTGPTGSVLKAKAGATYVLKNRGLRYQTLRNVVIDGNNRASRGFLTESTAGATSQSITLDHVWFWRCTVGLHLGNTGLTQADKNSLYDPQFIECDVGLWNESVNGQETILHNANFSSTYDTSVRMSGGSLHMIGGQFQGGTGTKGVEFTGPGVDWVQFNDVIFEGPVTDVDGSSFWPRDGVVAINTTFQGSTANVKMGAATSRLLAIASRFNDSPSIGGGQITCTGANCVVRLINCDYAVPVIDGAQAATCRYYRETDAKHVINTVEVGKAGPSNAPAVKLNSVSVYEAAPSHARIGGEFSVQPNGTGLIGLGVNQVGDSQYRFRVSGGGALEWSGGSGSLDITASRGAGGRLDLNSDLATTVIGKGFRVKEGTNAKQGVATLVAGTVTVPNTSVTANSRILLTVQSLGTVAAPKAIAVTARVNGTSFTITSADATDTSVVAWEIFEPGP